MRRFIETSTGERICTDSVASYRPEGSDKTLVILDSGDAVTVNKPVKDVDRIFGDTFSSEDRLLLKELMRKMESLQNAIRMMPSTVRCHF